MPTQSILHSFREARNFHNLPFVMKDYFDENGCPKRSADGSNFIDADFRKLGLSIPYQKMIDTYAMDALQPLITTASVPVPIQFLQEWLPGFVHILTGARKIDDLVGLAIMGAWEDEQVVQSVLELTGSAVPYGDYTNVPLSSWNVNYNAFTVVRFEEGMQVTNLEEARAARIQLNSGASKRDAAVSSLEIARNAIGFYGYNNGTNFTYGLLNTPGLPAYVTASVGASGSTLWKNKTYLEIAADIQSMVAAIQNNSQDQIDPEKTPLTLAVATSVYQYLGTSTNFGWSVRKYINDTYPTLRIVSAPELNAANGGANVGYMYADKLVDSSTDDGRVFMQVVPNKFRIQGVQQVIKGYLEGYTNSLAGVICKRPFAVTRITGI